MLYSERVVAKTRGHKVIYVSGQGHLVPKLHIKVIKGHARSFKVMLEVTRIVNCQAAQKSMNHYSFQYWSQSRSIDHKKVIKGHQGHPRSLKVKLEVIEKCYI